MNFHDQEKSLTINKRKPLQSQRTFSKDLGHSRTSATGLTTKNIFWSVLLHIIQRFDLAKKYLGGYKHLSLIIIF